MVEHELVAALSVSINLDFVREVSVQGGDFLITRRGARLEDRQQRRCSVVNFITLVGHTARGASKRT